MKKENIVKGLGVALTLSFLVTGCNSAKLKVGKTTVVKAKGIEVKANDYYNELKKDSVEKLITMIDKVLFKDYEISSEDNESINKQIEQIRTYYKEDEQFNAAIKQYFGVESESELREKLGLDFKRKAAVNEYLTKNTTDAEIKKYYDENVFADIKASHILISVKTTDDMSDDEKDKVKTEAYKKAQEVIEKLNNGEDFAKLAKKYSDDTANKNKGGDLGFFNSKQMDGGFWNGAVALKKGEYSKEPVESAYGYHIIKKTDEKKKKSLKSMKKEIKKSIAEDKLNNDKALYYKTLRQIREDKKISFGDDDMKKQYDTYMSDLVKNANSNNAN